MFDGLGMGSEPGLAAFLGCLGLLEGPEGLLGTVVIATSVGEGLVSPPHGLVGVVDLVDGGADGVVGAGEQLAVGPAEESGLRHDAFLGCHGSGRQIHAWFRPSPNTHNLELHSWYSHRYAAGGTGPSCRR